MAQVDLYIIGTGILGMDQASVQTREALGRCRKVFHLTSNHDALAALCQDVVDHAELYWTGLPARQVYRTIIDSVVDEVLNRRATGAPREKPSLRQAFRIRSWDSSAGHFTKARGALTRTELREARRGGDNRRGAPVRDSHDQRTQTTCNFHVTGGSD